MFLFVVENRYKNIQTLHTNVQGLNRLCKYFDYQEK